MRRQELNYILNAMLDTHPGISDLLFCANRPFQVETFGVLKVADIRPRIHSLTSYQIEKIALCLINNDNRLLRDLATRGNCDLAYTLSDRARFRVNVFRQRNHLSVIMRLLPAQIPTIESLSLQPIFKDIIKEKNGIILVTGATGSGKTTTLAAMLNELNHYQPLHIVTLEDPIEYVHPHRLATINQRELGNDFDTYPNGLRSALRQAPKVILVGEMRDRETVEIALTAAETGHLVLSTIHTVNAGQSINRILGMFETHEQPILRTRMADIMRWIISQRLVPRISGGRQLVNEILGNNMRTRETIVMGESDTRSYYDIIEQNSTFGWTTFDQSFARSYEAGLVTEETCLLYATNKARMTRYMDQTKKAKGIINESTAGMRLDLDNERASVSPSGMPLRFS